MTSISLSSLYFCSRISHFPFSKNERIETTGYPSFASSTTTLIGSTSPSCRYGRYEFKSCASRFPKTAYDFHPMSNKMPFLERCAIFAWIISPFLGGVIVCCFSKSSIERTFFEGLLTGASVFSVFLSFFGVFFANGAGVFLVASFFLGMCADPPFSHKVIISCSSNICYTTLLGRRLASHSVRKSFSDVLF